MLLVRSSDMECAFSRKDKRLEAGRDGYTIGYLLQVVGGRNGTGHIGILPAPASPCDCRRCYLYQLQSGYKPMH